MKTEPLRPRVGMLLAALAVLLLGSVAPTAAAGQTADSISGTVVVVAKGSPAAGVWPAMDVYVNGVKANGAAISVDSDTWETYTVAADTFVGGENRVDVVFVNDLWQDPEDRNLFVQSVTADGQTIAAAADGVVVDRGQGAAAFDGEDTIDGQEGLWWNAAIRFPLTINQSPPPNGQPGTVTVRALGTYAAGEWPQLQVRVNGEIASPPVVTVDNPAFEDFLFQTDNMTDPAVDPPQVDIVFLNDGYAEHGPGTADNKDRNLYVDSIFVDDRQISADDPRVVTDWGWGDEAFDGIDTEPGRYAMYFAGALRFDAYLVAESPPIEARDPLTAELVYEQDFASGEIDTENWNLYDQIGNAGWGLRRPEAFSVQDLDGALGGKALRITADMGQGDESDMLVSGGMLLDSVPQTYGRYTMRVRTEPDPDRVTTGVALLWPDTSNPAPYNVWPTGGEIDWYEGWRDRLARKPIDLVSHYVIDGVHDADEINLRGPDGVLVDGSEWHTYQLDWRPDYLAVSVDGGPPNILTDDPAKIPQWNMKMTVQLDAWQPLDNPGHQPTISQPVSMWVDWITVESYPEFAD